MTFLILLAVLMLSAACNTYDDPGKDIYENALYIDSSERRMQKYVSIDNYMTETITASIAKPEEFDVEFSYTVDETLVDVFNKEYKHIYAADYEAGAVLLPMNHWMIPSRHDIIKAGDVASGSITVGFYDILDLDKEVLYVLPVTIEEANIKVMKSRKTNYYVFRGANLINVVADMEYNYCEVKWQNPAVVTGMKEITIELLANANWDCGTDVGINALVGVEGYFLLRVGDYQHDPAELQVCFDGHSGLSTGPLLPYNEWVHIAVTYDLATKYCGIYVNGVLQESSSGITDQMFDRNGICLDNPDVDYPEFHIGKAYNNNRYIGGCISEVRIWNRALSSKELAEQDVRPYYVDPASEGLVAYWKFNEEKGSTVIDRTGNGNDAVAANPIQWTNVALPE